MERICDIREYPYYNLLKEKSKLQIDTTKGLFEFTIKRDLRGETRFLFFKFKKIFTVELSLVKGKGDNLHLYSDKIMIVSFRNLPLRYTKDLAYSMIDMYLEHLTKEEPVLSSYINIRKD